MNRSILSLRHTSATVFRLVTAVTVTGTLMCSLNAHSAVSAEDAEKLKTTLTPFGAERTGSADGVIPAWTGAPIKGGEISGGRRSDPFEGEKPLYSITSKNMAQYADKLTDGQQALLNKYPDYRLDVYPTHRTGIAPQWVYAATYKNATTAKLEDGNMKVAGAFGGIPFPIPKSGDEAIWNHMLHWEPASDVRDTSNYLVTADGSRVLLGTSKIYELRPYFMKDAADKFDGYFYKTLVATYAPATHSGEGLLAWDTLDRQKDADTAWTYLPGQRRVRKLPVISYDTPAAQSSGISNYDEINVFQGAPDRYEWKIVGKKEMVVPYNTNRALSAKGEQLLGKHFLDPDGLRWEVHRVWVIDAQLKTGKRHQIPHKRLYLDEDTWMAVLGDGWDANNQLVRSYWQWPMAIPDAPGVIPYAFGTYDLVTGSYFIVNLPGTGRTQYAIPSTALSGDLFTPDAMAAQGQ